MFFAGSTDGENDEMTVAEEQGLTVCHASTFHVGVFQSLWAKLEVMFCKVSQAAKGILLENQSASPSKTVKASLRGFEHCPKCSPSFLSSTENKDDLPVLASDVCQ